MLRDTDEMTLSWAQCLSEGTSNYIVSVDTDGTDFFSTAWVINDVEIYSRMLLVFKISAAGSVTSSNKIDWGADSSNPMSIENSYFNGNYVYFMGQTFSYKNDVHGQLTYSLGQGFLTRQTFAFGSGSYDFTETLSMTTGLVSTTGPTSGFPNEASTIGLNIGTYNTEVVEFAKIV
jgi:hypothetical protein